MSNPGALAQVVTKLVNNAVVHALADRQPGCIALTVSTEADTVTINVADDGRGIPQADLDRIFDPFFTTACGGGGSTGLGLHIVHNLVTATLQGRITVESTPGHGTQARIDLPKTTQR